jgi:cytochrome c biogenesis protein
MTKVRRWAILFIKNKMSAAEETFKQQPVTKRRSTPLLNRGLDFLSSVKFGVVQLCVLVVFSVIGMLIVQQNVGGFDGYYMSLTPSEKLVFGYLGFFDIYHSWYFNALLLLLSLNIVLASIDRFPTAWKYIIEPKLTATRDWLLNQKSAATFRIDAANEADALEKIKTVLEKHGFKKPAVTQATTMEYGVDAEGKKDFSVVNNRTATVVFGQTGRINRLGAYIVHVALLTLFLGHFVALQTGFDADVKMVPGTSTDQIQMIQFELDKKEKFDVKLPFAMECTDIQQRLIDPKGSIDVSNTLDWRTQLKIDDPDYGQRIADISMNKPFSYRGYRFFQAQTIPVGHGRVITIEATPQNGGEPVTTTIKRNGAADLPDGTKIEYSEFMPDFTFGPDGSPDTKSGDYNNPVAILNVTPPNGERTRVFAFAQKLADSMPVGAAKVGYKWRLTDYEKTPLAHVLSIKYDPYEAAFIAWYIGGFGLVGALAFVFFYSHRRVWALVERDADGHLQVVMAADANRNQIALNDKFVNITDELKAKLA